MEIAIDFFNNREKAFIIWLTIFLTWFFSKKENRKNIFLTLKTLCKSLFTGKVGIALYMMLIYIILMIICLYKINFWDYFLLKDTLLWFICSAFVLFVNVTKAYSERGYFKKKLRTILDSF